IDREHDDESRRSGARVACPTLFLWSAYDDMEDLYGDPLAIWRDWTTDLTGTRIESGHHMAEEAPEAVPDAVRRFRGPWSAAATTSYSSTRHIVRRPRWESA